MERHKTYQPQVQFWRECNHNVSPVHWKYHENILILLTPSHLTVIQSGYLLYCQSFSMDNSPSSVMLMMLNCPPSVMLPLWNSLSPELEISWVMNQVFASLKKINDMAFKYNYHSEWWICHLWLSVGTQDDHWKWYLAAVYILQDCQDTTLLLVLSCSHSQCLGRLVWLPLL